MTNYSVIIPTMWFSGCLPEMIRRYKKSSFINEIIIIDNDPTKTIKFDGVKYLTKGHNIFVNPAWNWGVKEAKNDRIIIANDDIIVDDIDSLLQEADIKKCEIIGADFDRGIWGFGCFMVMFKEDYLEIPIDLKIWFGDNWQLRNKKLRQIKGIKTEMNKTLKSFNSTPILESDKEYYESIIRDGE